MSIRPHFLAVLLLGLVGVFAAALASRPSAAPSAKITERPAIEGITAWLNTPDNKPLREADLDGKVVLIHFWTFGCYNCVNTIPHVAAWNAEFADDDFLLIGVHTPEFDMEKRQDRLAAFLQDHDITYPIAMDNQFTTWNNFDNHYWPADYLYDHEGKLIYRHSGEGDYEDMAERIRAAKAALPKAASTDE